MSSNPQQPSPTPPPPFERLVPYSRHINIALLVLGAVFAIVPIYLAIRAGGVQAALGPVFVWGVVIALVSLIAGLIGFGSMTQGRATEADKIRVLLLSAGGLLGLVTALLGFVLPFTDYKEDLSGGLTSWRAHPGALIWPGLALVGGFGLMFASIQLGRGMERQNPRIRRLIYGFNTMLMCLLLLAVLAIPNILAYAEPFARYFSQPYDWTSSNVYTLSPAMQNLLSNLQEPVKVYVMLQSGTIIASDTKTLMENCRSQSANFTWEFLDPSARANEERVDGFMRKYSLSDPEGLLIIRGVESDKSKADHTFVKMRELFDQTSGARQAGGFSYKFLGENALYMALVDLIEGKLVVYLTQGHGELSLEGNQPRMPPGMPPRASGELSVLKQKLTERKSVRVEPLTVDRALTKVPDDASVVVVARPTQAFAPEEAKVLIDYAKRSAQTSTRKEKDGREVQEEKVTAGKLILLFNPVIQKLGDTTRMAPTGLDALLAQYNIKLGDDRILCFGNLVSDPLQVIAVTNPTSSNPMAKAFNSPDRQTLFPFRNVRTVDAAGQHPGLDVQQLLLVPPQYGFWSETNLEASPAALVSALRRDQKLALKKLTAKPLCVAVTVAESSGGVPNDFAHAGVDKDSTPRLVVFGSADWIKDDALNSGEGSTRMDLMNSCISWLRKKAAIGGKPPIEGKERVKYQPNIAPQDLNRLLFLPLAMMLLAVVALGTGVWVVRRR
jgi:hypothetical protein